MKLEFEKINKNAVIPSYAHEGDAGMDLFSVDEICIQPGEFKMISTGLKMKLPKGTEGQVRPRSGLAAKFGISLVNSPGTIDEGYRGELKVIVINHGKEPFLVEVGTKIAQMVIAPVLKVSIQEVEKIDDNTERADGGFGSTGTK